MADLTTRIYPLTSILPQGYTTPFKRDGITGVLVTDGDAAFFVSKGAASYNPFTDPANPGLIPVPDSLSERVNAAEQTLSSLKLQVAALGGGNAIVAASITGAAPTIGQAGMFTVTMANAASVWVVLARVGVEEGSRVQRTGNGVVSLTPARYGFYTARVYAAATGGTPLAETTLFRVTPALAAFRQVAGRTGLPADYSAGAQALQSWLDVYPLYNGGRYLRVQIVNRMLGGTLAETVPVNPTTYKLALRVNGTLYPLTFGGSATVTLAGGAKANADDLDVTYNDGDQIQVIDAASTTGTDAATRKIAVHAISQNTALGERFAADVDKTDGSAFTTGATGNHAPTALILGRPNLLKNSFCIIGSSSAFGLGDTSGGQGKDAAFGYIPRALSLMNLPHGRAAISGDTFLRFNATNTYRSEYLTDGGFTIAILQLGPNDITNGATFQQMKDRTLQACDIIAARVPSIIIHAAHCVTSSTDNWATTKNQTPDPSTDVRLNWNAWLRTIPHDAIRYVFDANPVVADPSDPTVWRSNGTAKYYTIDGKHLAPAMHEAVAADQAPLYAAAAA